MRRTKERGRNWHSATKNCLPEGKPRHGHHQATSARQEDCGNPDRVPSQRYGCSCLWLQRVPEPVASKGGWQRYCLHEVLLLPTQNTMPTVSLFFEEEDVSYSLSQQPPYLSWLLLSINSRKAGIARHRPPQSRQQGHGCFTALLWFGLLPNCLLMLISRCFAQPTSESQQQSLIIAGNGTRTLIDNQPVYGNNNLSLKCIPRMLPQTHCLWISFKQLLTTLQHQT